MAIDVERAAVNEWRRHKGGSWHAWTGASDTCQCLRHTRTFDEDGEPSRSRQGGWQSRRTPPHRDEPVCQDCAEAVNFKRRKPRTSASKADELVGELRNVSTKIGRALQRSASVGHRLANAAATASEQLACLREEEGEEACAYTQPVKCAVCLVRHPLDEAIKAFREAIPTPSDEEE